MNPMEKPIETSIPWGLATFRRCKWPNRRRRCNGGRLRPSERGAWQDLDRGRRETGASDEKSEVATLLMGFHAFFESLMPI